MSSCIYHDAEAVTICPSCDFGVCQQCMDEGEDGICATCAEERSHRRAQSAVQREYETAVAVKRCSYCRAAEDDETPLDEQGYCPTCAVLSRCTTHSELVAVGHCKSCRQEYCRKCLGFTDICQSCQAKPKVAPSAGGTGSKPAAGRAAPGKAASARPGTGRAAPARAQASAGTPKTGHLGKSAKTGRMPEPDAPARRRKSPPSGKPGARPDDKRKRRPEAAGPAGKGAKPAQKNKRPLSRGEQALLAKREAASPGLSRSTFLFGGVGALICVVFLAGMFHPPSEGDYMERTRGQMLAVHRAVLGYYQKTQRLPSNAQDLQVALSELRMPEARGVKLRFNQPPDAPGQVVYRSAGAGFEIKASGLKGGYLMHGEKQLILDQYYDSGGQAPINP